MSQRQDARRWAGGQAAGGAARRGAVGSILPRCDVIVEPALRHDGRVVGQFVRRAADGRIVLRKHVNPERHMLRNPPAWAIAEQHYQRLLALGGVGVELVADDGRRWWAPVEAFGRHVLRIARDVDVQLALPLARWRCEAPGVRQGTLDELLAAGGVGEVAR